MATGASVAVRQEPGSVDSPGKRVRYEFDFETMLWLWLDPGDFMAGSFSRVAGG